MKKAGLFQHSLGRLSVGDRIFTLIVLVLISILLVIFVYPLIYTISCSFSDPVAIWGGQILLFPKGFNLEGYKMILARQDIWVSYYNTIIYVILGTTLCLIMTFITAYPLSRKDFVPRNIIIMLYVFCMYFNGGLIPTYMLIKSLNMLNTIWALIVPGAISTINVIIVRTFINSTIPFELHEAAQIDGCTNTRFFLSVVIPLSKPIIAVIGLMAAVGYWNMYFQALLYLSDQSKYPLQMVLRGILFTAQLGVQLGQGDTKHLAELVQVSANLKYVVVIVSSAPILLIYPLVQRHFIKGVMIGSIKA